MHSERSHPIESKQQPSAATIFPFRRLLDPRLRQYTKELLLLLLHPPRDVRRAGITIYIYTYIYIPVYHRNIRRRRGLVYIQRATLPNCFASLASLAIGISDMQIDLHDWIKSPFGSFVYRRDVLFLSPPFFTLWDCAHVLFKKCRIIPGLVVFETVYGVIELYRICVWRMM